MIQVLYKRADSANTYKLESVAVALRGGKYSYISLETALSEYGIINQMMLGHLTVMTTGRNQKIRHAPWNHRVHPYFTA